MHRRIAALPVALALLLAGPVVARADTTGAAQTAEADADATDVEGVADQEIGGRLGLRMGGRTTPGGFSVGGVYLYRITGSLWSDSSVTFTLGGGGAECFRDRQDLVVCDHGQLDGIAGGAHSGVRWIRPGKQGFVPYLRATLGVELVNYGDDDVNGVAIPVVVGGGVRARVADRISVGGGADLHIGLGRLSKDIGTEPHVALSVMLGVDFAL